MIRISTQKELEKQKAKLQNPHPTESYNSASEDLDLAPRHLGAYIGNNLFMIELSPKNKKPVSIVLDARTDLPDIISKASSYQLQNEQPRYTTKDMPKSELLRLLESESNPFKSQTQAIASKIELAAYFAGLSEVI